MVHVESDIPLLDCTVLASKDPVMSRTEARVVEQGQPGSGFPVLCGHLSGLQRDEALGGGVQWGPAE